MNVTSRNVSQDNFTGSAAITRLDETGTTEFMVGDIGRKAVVAMTNTSEKAIKIRFMLLKTLALGNKGKTTKKITFTNSFICPDYVARV
ncbi:hypothetical protein GCM10028807_46110 [Spirosoma daeguense]